MIISTSHLNFLAENYQAAVFKENKDGEFDIVDDFETGKVLKAILNNLP